jgi:transglutaminase-like putative cysteine protease/predicted glutamine amidotransferase
MSELLALSFDADASPAVRFREPRNGAPATQPAVYGWGIGWYPRSERGASVIKDPTSSGKSTVNEVLGDWQRFRSTLFLCHLRGHTRPRAQEDAQPFVRSYGGHQWIFAHDGDLAPGWQDRLELHEDPAFEPLGKTDSEHAFCWILAQLHARKARALSEVPGEELVSWLQRVNEGGRANVILSDGESLLVYRDGLAQSDLFWTRRIPPHATTRLESDAVLVVLDSPQDPNRTALVFSSVPLSTDVWLPLAAGQLILARRGSVVWDSQPFTTSFLPRSPGGGEAFAPRLEAAHQMPGAEAAYATAVPSPARGAVESRPEKRDRLLSVLHETIYAYELPVERSTHRLLLRPVEDHLQKIESFDLDLQPGGILAPFEDVFGNHAYALEIAEPYRNLEIRARSLVRVAPSPTIEERLSRRRMTIPLVWMPWQRQMLAAYLLAPELPESQLEELSEFAMSFVERNGSDLVGTLLDMTRTIYQDFEYVSGSTSVANTPFDAMQSRRGVCQDFANLMVCLARLLNVPARYRMGYLLTGADYENRIQSDASHAWAELYVPQMGWHGFDPTNGRQVGSDHVRVACGRHYRDATPTSGTIYRGGGTETLTVRVQVEEVDEISD